MGLLDPPVDGVAVVTRRGSTRVDAVQQQDARPAGVTRLAVAHPRSADLDHPNLDHAAA
ncbi:hypothetical protein GCM10009558_110390 [Virgisporangium aurantiacum]